MLLINVSGVGCMEVAYWNTSDLTHMAIPPRHIVDLIKRAACGHTAHALVTNRCPPPFN